MRMDNTAADNTRLFNEARKVRFECFGNFSVFVDDKPLLITRAKVREMLAYLVHKRGLIVRTGEMAAVLWEDKENNDAVKANMRQVFHRLLSVLRDAGVEDIIIKKRDNMAVDITKISCDYYDFIVTQTKGAAAFNGEYMNEYSWAEFTTGYLNNLNEK